MCASEEELWVCASSEQVSIATQPEISETHKSTDVFIMRKKSSSWNNVFEEEEAKRTEKANRGVRTSTLVHTMFSNVFDSVINMYLAFTAL